MDEPEGFLGRWSRLKRGGDTEPAPPQAEPDPPEPAAVEEPADEPPPLPPIESLDGGSDYTAFLAKGVPEELKRLALRRAWTSDPKIADFRGFGEYDWDFNAPGYGALRATDDLVKLVDAVLRPPEPEPQPSTASEEPALVAEAAEDPPQDEPPTEDPDQADDGDSGRTA